MPKHTKFTTSKLTKELRGLFPASASSSWADLVASSGRSFCASGPYPDQTRDLDFFFNFVSNFDGTRIAISDLFQKRPSWKSAAVAGPFCLQKNDGTEKRTRSRIKKTAIGRHQLAPVQTHRLGKKRRNLKCPRLKVQKCGIAITHMAA